MKLIYTESSWDAYPLELSGGVLYLKLSTPVYAGLKPVTADSVYEVFVPEGHVGVLELDHELYRDFTLVNANTDYELRLEPGKHALELQIVRRQDSPNRQTKLQPGEFFGTFTLFCRDEESEYVQKVLIELVHYRDIKQKDALNSLRRELTSSLERTFDNE